MVNEDEFWIDLTKKEIEYVTIIKMSYIMDHLDSHARNELKTDGKIIKIKKLNKTLDVGVNPIDIDPIYLSFNLDKKEFEVHDGFHRLEIYWKRKIPAIRVKVYLY